MSSRVLILGCGYAGRALARLARARGFEVVATVRSEERERALVAEGFRVERTPVLDERLLALIDADTHVVIAFPPDGVSEARIAPWLARAAAVTAISSTAIYGELHGVIDSTTIAPEPSTPRARRAAAAEAEYRRAAATILRCPGIYGPDRGLHVRILRGLHRIPGDGTRTLSRIHIDDLAQMILATRALRSRSFVVGDREPAPQIDVVRFVCTAYGAPFPPSVPLADAPESLQADRRVDGSLALRELGVELAYPSYREGMAPSATGLSVGA